MSVVIKVYECGEAHECMDLRACPMVGEQGLVVTPIGHTILSYS